ncbi:hypothetical protein BGX27_007664 [Mortierella sp. AM989]|nr:hypothetical protein BGX27_007664 [Mortierella sp. AM989]
MAYGWSLERPMTIDNPEICATATKNATQALRDIYSKRPSTTQRKPLITVISTTGVSNVHEDVTFDFRILYHIMLKDPLMDKEACSREYNRP